MHSCVCSTGPQLILLTVRVASWTPPPHAALHGPQFDQEPMVQPPGEHDWSQHAVTTARGTQTSLSHDSDDWGRLQHQGPLTLALVQARAWIYGPSGEQAAVVACRDGGSVSRTRVCRPVPQLASHGDHVLQSDTGHGSLPEGAGHAGVGDAQPLREYTCTDTPPSKSR